MKLYDAISTRKSCRTFKKEPLSNEKLEAIENAVKSFDVLYPDVTLHYRFAQETKGFFNVKAPYYLIISGTGDKRDQEAAGFLFQQLMLWLSLHGIGAVWMGGSKVPAKGWSSNDIIPIAFGAPEGPINRTTAELNGKRFLRLRTM